MAPRKIRIHPIDMSLRLSSADMPLDGFVAHLGLPVGQLHRPGEPMGTSGPLARRIATQHYASLAASEGLDGADVARWIEIVVAAIAPHASIVDALRTDQITGVLWIAILGRAATPTPGIATDHIEAVSTLGLRLFLENYSTWDGEGDAPPKIWLPAEPGSSSIAPASV